MWVPTEEVGIVQCTKCDDSFRPSVRQCDCPGDDELIANDEPSGSDALLAGGGEVDSLDEIQRALIALTEETREARRRTARAKKDGLSRSRASAALADVERKLLLARADIEIERSKIRALLKAEATAERIRAIRERRAH